MFNAQFWKTLLENVIYGAAAGGLAQLQSNAPLSLHELAAIGIGMGTGAVVTLLKQLGGVQQAAGTLKVKAGISSASSTARKAA